MSSKSRLLGVAPVVALIALLLLIGNGTVVVRAADDTKESFTAQAANLSNVGRSGAVGRVDVTITRWSTDEEGEQLRTALIENGTEALLKALRKMKPVGFIRGNDSIGWDLRYAHEITTGSSRRIIFATDRPISWLEARNQPRTIDYRFSFGELRLNGEGKGDGTLAVAVKVKYDANNKVIELENYASEPLRLLQVTKVK